MDRNFRYDPTVYREQVVNIAGHVVAGDAAVPSFAPRPVYEDNSYHGFAIRKADQDRLQRLYPRLHL